MRPILVSLAALALAAPASAVSIEWVTVGAPGNECNPTGHAGEGVCLGAVDYTYRISKYEVTNEQYVEFLNAKAASNLDPLWSSSMAIARDGEDGSYSYSVVPGYEGLPVVNVTPTRAMRFTNWMNNGQGDGSYTTGTYQSGVIGTTRSPSATIVLPTRDEWYKAAFYDADTSIYFASLDPEVAGPWGTFDQPGSVAEITETVLEDIVVWRDEFENEIEVVVNGRAVMGGNSVTGPLSAVDSGRFWNDGAQSGLVGFRLAMVIPEPTTLSLLGFGLLGLRGIKRRSPDATRSRASASTSAPRA